MFKKKTCSFWLLMDAGNIYMMRIFLTAEKDTKDEDGNKIPYEVVFKDINIIIPYDKTP